MTAIVAAGNDDADACQYSPAGSPYAITVGATDIIDDKSDFSNWGDCVDIFAPGTDIYSTAPGGGYKYMSGTSMACPIVSGVASYFATEAKTSDYVTIKKILQCVAS